MAYIPTEWKTGDVITADKLNKIEQGIANKVFIVEVIGEGESLADPNATWGLASATSLEIKDAVENNKLVPMLHAILHNTISGEDENFVGTIYQIWEVEESPEEESGWHASFNFPHPVADCVIYESGHCKMWG